jgi:hypothetical protein
MRGQAGLCKSATDVTSDSVELAEQALEVNRWGVPGPGTAYADGFFLTGQAFTPQRVMRSTSPPSIPTFLVGIMTKQVMTIGLVFSPEACHDTRWCST